MKLHIGSSTVRVEGFLNVDVRSVDGVDVVAHAGRLSGVGDGTVDVIFANAFLEHLFVAQQLPVLREWRRVLSPDGTLIVLGIPDFRVIADAYLSGAPGIVGDRFDLFNVYRYSHGDPEQAGPTSEPSTWARWDPGRTPDAAPPGWLPQLHKSLYDGEYLSKLLGASGFYPVTFHYAWGDETVLLNMGVIAVAADVPRGDAPDPVSTLRRLVPGVERFMRIDSVRRHAASSQRDDLMLDHARRLDATGRTGAPPTEDRTASGLRRLLDRFTR